MTPGARRLALIAMGLWLLWPAGARAEPSDRERVSALLVEGAALYDQHQYVRALDKFQAAYAMVPSPRILYNIAKVMDELHNNPDAANAYARFLRGVAHDKGMANDARVEAAQHRLTELAISVGRLQIQVQPAQARVQVDRAPLQDLDVYVAPGAHEVHAEAPGFQPATQILAVAAGQSAPVALQLAPGLDAVAGMGGTAGQREAHATGGLRQVGGGVLIAAGALGVGALVMTEVTVAQYSQLPLAPRPAPATFSGAYATELTLARVTDGLWAGAVVAGAVGGSLWFFGGPSPGSGGEVGVAGHF